MKFNYKILITMFTILLFTNNNTYAQHCDMFDCKTNTDSKQTFSTITGAAYLMACRENFYIDINKSSIMNFLDGAFLKLHGGEKCRTWRSECLRVCGAEKIIEFEGKKFNCDKVYMTMLISKLRSQMDSLISKELCSAWE